MRNFLRVFLLVFLHFIFTGCAEPYSPVKDVDSTPPEVSETSPADNESSVPADSTVVIRFSKPVSNPTVHSSSIKMIFGNLEIPGELILSENATSVEFIPEIPLNEGGIYTVEVERTITDLNGLPLKTDGTDSPYRFSFTILSTVPSVIASSPADSETVVASTLENITVTFSEDMDPATINNSTFFIEDTYGDVEYDTETKTASFIPDEKLMHSTSYQLILTNGITDLAGIPLENGMIINFITAEE